MKINLIILGLVFFVFSFIQYGKYDSRMSAINAEISARQNELKTAIEKGVDGQEKLEFEYMVERAKTHKASTLKHSSVMSVSPFIIGLALCFMGLFGSSRIKKKESFEL